MPKLSIIVPVYNVEKYLEQCIESLINQTYKDIEIILVDDGSKDNSGNICEQYKDRDMRIKVIHKENEGVSKARNKGLELATGKYITFVDSDDYLELNAYEIIMKELEKEKATLLIYNYSEFSNDKIEKNNYFPEDTFLKTKEEIQLIQALTLAPEIGKYTPFQTTFFGLGFCWNKIYKREIIEQNKIRFNLDNKTAIFEDGIFNYEYLENATSIKIINLNLYYYRIFNMSAMKRINYDILNINKKIFQEIEKYKSSHTHDIYYNTSFYLRVIINLFYAIKLYFCHKENNKSYLERYKEFKKCIDEEKIYKEALKNIDIQYCNYKIKIYKLLINLKMYFLLFNISSIFNKTKN